MYAYSFNSYWKDVGTIKASGEANMDLLGPKPQFVLHNESGKIYARNDASPGSYLATTARVSESFIAEGCEIAGEVVHSVISTGPPD